MFLCFNVGPDVTRCLYKAGCNNHLLMTGTRVPSRDKKYNDSLTVFCQTNFLSTVRPNIVLDLTDDNSGWQTIWDSVFTSGPDNLGDSQP